MIFYSSLWLRFGQDFLRGFVARIFVSNIDSIPSRIFRESARILIFFSKYEFLMGHLFFHSIHGGFLIVL